ncbi:MAG: pyruvate kinase [Pirellulales bacterium]|nr:pyruvate kinase [Pirellulales bacterium]
MISPQSFRNRSRTKIVATIGPACDGDARLRELVLSGVDVFRLNMAHAGTVEQQRHVDTIRRISEALDYPIAILVDLAGPKIRLGEIAGGVITCQRDEEFFLVDDEPAGPNELTSTYTPLTKELSAGNLVMLADGTVSMVVEERSPGRVRMRVIQPGTIRSRQGINLPGVPLSVPSISQKDRTDALWAAKAGIDFLGLSFVRSAEDVRILKEIIQSADCETQVIAKIEKREALDALDSIVQAADVVMVARGDLGVEIDVARIAIEQKRIIQVCQRHCKPVIIATQMLDSMQHSKRPTRAEATDVANAILDGADACMLSGETAIGRYPIEAVSMMNRIALATEESLRDQPLRLPSGSSSSLLHEVTRAVVHGASDMAYDLKAELVIVASHSGRTALVLSQHRSTVPTVGVSSSEATLRRMCLYWGVTPLRGAPARDIESLIQHTDAWGCQMDYLKPGNRVVIVGGSHLTAGPDHEEMTSGVHDVVVVHEVEER